MGIFGYEFIKSSVIDELDAAATDGYSNGLQQGVEKATKQLGARAKQLETANEKLKAKLEKVEAERDALREERDEVIAVARKELELERRELTITAREKALDDRQAIIGQLSESIKYDKAPMVIPQGADPRYFDPRYR